jgi:mRNA interferase MazF
LPSSEPKRGEIWQVDFDPTKGSEIKKRRPAVIVSSDALGVLPVRLVVPLTEWNDSYAGKIWIVRIDASYRNGLTKDSAAETLQTRSVSLERLSNKLGILEERLLEQVVSALAISVEAV